MIRKPAASKKRGTGASRDKEEGFRPLRRKMCKFCADKVAKIDFRDTERLSKCASERGKILPRRVSGACARHQRQLSRAIKRARSIALAPYIAE